jgi:LacI family transcriptional regulator
LRLNRADTIGVITNRVIGSLFAGRLISGLDYCLRDAGIASMIIETDDDPRSNDEATAAFLDRGTDVIVYTSIEPMPVHPSPAAAGVRSIYLNCWPGGAPDGPIILADEYHGGRAIAEEIYAQGHSRVAFIGGPENEFACTERLRGFKDATTAAGIDPAQQYVTFGEYDMRAGYNLTSHALAEFHPTAIVCGNDFMAIGAYLAVRDQGRRIPTDISIVGFDDDPEVASGAVPALSTVALPHFAMGTRAGEIVLNPEEPHRRELIPCEVILRDSIAPPN